MYNNNNYCPKTLSLDYFLVPVSILIFLSFQNVTGGQEHRQAMLISGSGHEEGKLLAVVPVQDGTGLTQSSGARDCSCH